MTCLTIIIEYCILHLHIIINTFIIFKGFQLYQNSYDDFANITYKGKLRYAIARSDSVSQFDNYS